ncbi:MAG: molybdopterin-dependent oxidoreductase [Chloroflexi bacterium]|nr:molybdopterin-dependent oxidoreductase [Chloroflexota bacterium]
MVEFDVIGQRLPRIDAWAKVIGAAQFTNDITLPRMLYGRILLSPYPHARILNIDTSRAERLPGVKAVITGKDTAGVRFGVFRETRDQLALPIEKVRYVGEEVAAVAAIDPDIAQEAADLIRVDYDPLPGVFDPIEGMQEGAPLVHENVERNIGAKNVILLGDVEQGFQNSDYIREDRFQTEAISHAQMEPYAAVVSYDGTGNFDVWVPNQGPIMKRRALSNTLKVPLDNVRIRKIHIGGAFGGRSEMMPMEFCAALLSMKTNRPVKIYYSREENFSSTRQKHPFIVQIKTGVKQDGTLMAQSFKVIADGGAYLNTGPITISDPPVILTSLYRLPSIRWEAYRIYTNKPVRGAMRGQGSQQTRFANESHMDMIAEELGIDPVELRLRNATQPGDMLINKSRVTSCGLSEAIQKSAASAQWADKRGKLPEGRGVGIGCSGMICGFSLGIRTVSAAFVKFNEDGQATILSGVVDNGQGNEMMVAQIAAEALGLPLEAITVVNGDTQTTPQDPGTYSMQATFVSGNAARLAAADAKRQLLEIAAEKLEANTSDLEARNGRIFVKGSPEKGMTIRDAVWTGLSKGRPVLGQGYWMPKIDHVDSVRGKIEGQMTGAYTFGATVAEVEVDKQTGELRVCRVAGAHDCGRAINPTAVEGQLEGSVIFGQGQAMSESIEFDGGHMFNPRFTTYGLITALEAPEVDPIIVETVDPNGPFGAKEAAETINIAIVPAIANAIYDAIGVRIHSLPITPEKILQALEEKEKKSKI